MMAANRLANWVLESKEGLAAAVERLSAPAEIHVVVLVLSAAVELVVIFHD